MRIHIHTYVYTFSRCLKILKKAIDRTVGVNFVNEMTSKCKTLKNKNLAKI